MLFLKRILWAGIAQVDSSTLVIETLDINGKENQTLDVGRERMKGFHGYFRESLSLLPMACFGNAIEFTFKQRMSSFRYTLGIGNNSPRFATYKHRGRCATILIRADS